MKLHLRKVMWILSGFGIGALIVACAPDPDTQMNIQQPSQLSNGDVQVTRIGVIKDNIAYGDIRGIYRIVDTKTGKEFIGVSGVGIAETGSHSTGKTSTTDER